MDAYEPLNLSGICNAGPELPGERSGVTAGVRHYQGLPFLIGRDDAKASPCLLGFGNGFPDQPESIPVRKTALRVIVAHGTYFACRYPSAASSSAMRMAPPAAPRTVLWLRAMNL